MIVKKVSVQNGVSDFSINKPTYFADLDLDLTMNPSTGDLILLKNSFAIRRSVRNLVMLARGEKPFSPSVGTNIRQILFENITPDTAGRLQSYITETLIAYEPRITLQGVEVIPSYQENGYSVTIRFYLKNAETEIQNISLLLERIR